MLARLSRQRPRNKPRLTGSSVCLLKDSVGARLGVSKEILHWFLRLRRQICGGRRWPPTLVRVRIQTRIDWCSRSHAVIRSSERLSLIKKSLARVCRGRIRWKSIWVRLGISVPISGLRCRTCSCCGNGSRLPPCILLGTHSRQRIHGLGFGCSHNDGRLMTLLPRMQLGLVALIQPLADEHVQLRKSVHDTVKNGILEAGAEVERAVSVMRKDVALTDGNGSGAQNRSEAEHSLDESEPCSGS